MPARSRNRVLEDNWVLEILDTDESFKWLESFDCDDEDLNEFFRKDAVPHKKELLAEIYSLRLIEATGESAFDPVAFVTFHNDAIQLSHKERERLLPPSKARYRSLPAVKIGRLGVEKEYQRNNIGTNLLNMVKRLFVTQNRTGCRFLTVDAYNDPRVINFYERNDFRFLHEKDKNKDTRIMYFDLNRLKEG